MHRRWPEGRQLSAVEAAQARGDTAEAAELLARALWARPGDVRLQAAADALAPLVEVDDILPLTLRTPPHTAAMRARLLAVQGQLDEAVSLLLQLSLAEPEVPCLPWALSWLSADPSRATQLDIDAIRAALSGAPEHAPWGHIAALLELLWSAHPEQPALAIDAATAARRAGRPTQASRLACAAYTAAPSAAAALACAASLRAAGELDAAAEAYARAHRHAPRQPGPTIDCGDMLREAGRYTEALLHYEAALALRPGHPWATAAAHELRHRAGDRSARIALLETWIAHPEHPRCRQLARQSTPWLGYLRPPWEALVGFARTMTPAQRSSVKNQALARRLLAADTSPLRHTVTLSRPEAPSAQLIARLALAGSGVSLHVEVEGYPWPDPRQPRARDLRWSLWQFDDADAHPALPAPDSESLAALITTLARRDPSLDAAASGGRWLGGRCAASVIEPLLALMVHPPPPPAGTPPWDWLVRVQRSCALTIAAVGGGWSDSTRREALRALILGPSDWSVAAGAWAAVALADHDGTGALETLDWILARLRDEPVDAYCGQTWALSLAALFHPAMSPDGRRSLLDVIGQAEALLG